MKKSLTIVIALMFYGFCYTQPLTGTKTIKKSGGDYSSFYSAITALNSNGVGSGGVTFNVDAGFVDTAANLLITTATSTSSRPIIFQKNGTGANPLIIAAKGTGYMDGIIKISGTDFITFDHIDIRENPCYSSAIESMEWGFALFKASAINACKSVTIKNCTIEFSPLNSNPCYGINSGNNTISGSTLTITDTNGCSSHHRFYSNTINNASTAIYLTGYNVPSPYLQELYDSDNQIGVDGANIISNFSTTPYMNIAGVYTFYQNKLVVANNIITINSTSDNQKTGIFTYTESNSSVEIYNNTISITNTSLSGNSYRIIGILNQNGSYSFGNTVHIFNNKVQNCKFNGYGTVNFYGINNSGSANNVTIHDNIVSEDSLASNGSFYGIFSDSSTTLSIYNNKVQNNIKTDVNGNFFCYWLDNATKLIYNNIADNCRIAGGSGSLYGIYSEGTTIPFEQIYNNKVSRLINDGYGKVYGIYSNSVANNNKQIYNDSIYSLTSNGGTVYGLFVGGGTGAKVFNNVLFDLTATNTSGVVYGVSIASGIKNYLFNNFIYDLKTPAANSSYAIFGIYLNQSIEMYLYNNTVFLNASSSAKNFGSSALYASSYNTMELKNNILVNVSVPGSTGGKTIAYYRTSNYNNFPLISDHNCLFAGTPAANRLIYSDYTYSDQTLATFKIRFEPNEMNSFSEYPPFINSATAPYNLHLSPSVATLCESGGIPIINPINIKTDFDGDARDSLFPDVGADEGNFLLNDLFAPALTFNQLKNTSSTSARSLTVNFIDVSGVPVNVPGLPKLFWKKGKYGVWTDDTASYSGNSGFKFLFGSGVAIGDTIFYYLVAQDSAAIPNVGSYPNIGSSGFSYNPPSVTTPPSKPYSYVIIPGINAGNYKIGGTGNTPASGCVYVDLTAAIADLSGKELTGPIKLLLTKNYSSTQENSFPVIFNSITGQDSINTITISPDSGVTTKITTSSSNSVLKFDKTNYYIIDGSNNRSVSRDLTISNTNATATYVAGVWIGSGGAGKGSSFITIKNCNIQMGSLDNSVIGILLGSSTSVGPAISAPGGNNNISIQNNEFTKCSTGVSALGGIGQSIDYDYNIQIKDNVFGSLISANKLGGSGFGLSYCKKSTVSNNRIFNISAATGFVITFSEGIEIYGNKIYGIQGINRNASGMYLVSDTNLTIYNNAIYDVISNKWTFGIDCESSTNCKFYYNSIYLTGDRDALSTNKASGYSAAIYIYNSTYNVLKNNVFANTQTAPTYSPKSYAVYAYNYNGIPFTPFSSTNYNDYFVAGSQGVLGYNNVNIDSLNDWKSTFTFDTNSISVDPLFNSTTTLSPNIGSPVLGAGKPVPGITSDITGNSRSATNPSIGAYEISSDVSGPVISYIAFLNTASLTSRQLTVTITDVSGVPTTGSGLPVLYWKKKYSGSWFSVTAVSTGSDKYNFTFGSGVVLGDSIYYYIAAQDMMPTPNVSVYPANGANGFTFNPPAVIKAPANPDFYKIIGKISGGNYLIGGSGSTPCPTCTYVDLTAAFNNLKDKEVAGPITLKLTSYYKSSEEDAFPVVIYPLLGTSATNTITIKPETGTNDTIKGISSSSILSFAGADYIIIDGSNNNTSSQNLIIQNNSTASNTAAINFASQGWNKGATYNTIKNCVIMAGNGMITSYGISIGSAIGVKGEDNDNITLKNNAIKRAGLGIYAAGTYTAFIDSLQIEDNIIGDTIKLNYVGKNGIYLEYATDCEIVGNTIKNMMDGSNNALPTAISMSSEVVNSKILKNKITGIKYTGSSIATSGRGIVIETFNNNSNILIANNMLSDITGTGNYVFPVGCIMGIVIDYSGGLNIYNNSINLTGNITYSAQPNSKSAAIYLGNHATNLDIRNNVFANSILNTSVKATAYAIYNNASNNPFITIDYNDYIAKGTQGVLGYYNVNTATINEWKAASGHDSNSISREPFFTSSADLHSNSPYLNNAGISIPSVTTDIDGELRKSNPDIGADEYDLKPLAITLSAQDVTSDAAKVRGLVNAYNTGNASVSFDYGITASYGTTVNADQNPVNGNNDSTVSHVLTGLIPFTTYHYRVKATNIDGTTFGADSTFKTLASLPSVITSLMSIISYDSALGGGNVVTDGGSPVSVRGTVWNTTPNPDISLSTKTTDGTGTGIFISHLNGLSQKTLYYLRAYATNNIGTAYGNEISFTTWSSGLNNGSKVSEIIIFSYAKTIVIKNPAGIKTSMIIEVTDIMGRNVLKTKLSGIQQIINMSGMASGYYQVKVISDGKLKIGKVFIE